MNIKNAVVFLFIIHAYSLIAGVEEEVKQYQKEYIKKFRFHKLNDFKGQGHDKIHHGSCQKGYIFKTKL